MIVMPFGISIKKKSGKRETLMGSGKVVTFGTRGSAKKFIGTLTPDTIKYYQPRIKKHSKRKRKR